MKRSSTHRKNMRLRPLVYSVSVIGCILLIRVIFICHLMIMTDLNFKDDAVKAFDKKITSSNPKYDYDRKGAIVALVKGGHDKKEYRDVIRRNKSVRKYIWKCCQMDVIIFHEGDLIQEHQAFIQSHTLDMPIIFINISSIFSQFEDVNLTACPSTKQSRRFNSGYHSMCYFWFVAFRKYMKSYDWLFRFDADCEAKEDYSHIIPHRDVYFSSSIWLDLRTEKYDMISANNPDGQVVLGMKHFINQFIYSYNIKISENYLKKNKIFDSNSTYLSTWRAPYTNVMYLNLTWLRSHILLNEFINKISESKCIYSNRWGDSPLWGAAVSLAGLDYSRLPVSYYHGSHHLLVKGDGTLVNQRWSFRTMLSRLLSIFYLFY